MKRWLIALLLLFGSLAWTDPAAAETPVPPRPTSSIYVQDYAGVLSEDAKAHIRAQGARLAAQTKAQVVVVTVPTLDGANPDEFGLAILRQWGIGDKKLNNGVLMLVAVQDRISRIEVGYGLEGALPDGKTGRIQDENMVPFFKQGKYEAGIVNGYQALTSVVAKEYNVELKQGTAQSQQPATQKQSSNWFDELPLWVKVLVGLGLIGLLLIDWLFLGGNITSLIIMMLTMGRRGGGGNGGGSDGFGGGSGGGGGSSRNW